MFYMHNEMLSSAVRGLPTEGPELNETDYSGLLTIHELEVVVENTSNLTGR